MNESREAVLADAALADDQDCGVVPRDLRGDAKCFLHGGTGHTETKFLFGTMPVRTWASHGPLMLTDRHHVGSAVVRNRC